MKKLILGLALLVSSTLLTAQNLNYKKLYDNPVKPWFSLNLELLQLDLNVSNLDAMSFGSGIFGYVEPVNGLGIDYVWRQSWFTAGDLGFKDYAPNKELEIGAHYILFSKTKQKNTKIVLSREYKGSTYSYNPTTKTGTRTTTEEIKFINIPANRMINTGLRAGLIRKAGPYGFSEKEEELGIGIIVDGYANLKSTGFYVGLLSQYYTNVFAEVESYGIRYNSIGRDVYFDVLFIPTNNFEIIESDPVFTANFLNENLSDSPFGFRLGFSTYQTEKKTRTGKFFGTGGKLELGMKPYQGFYAMASFSITLVKAQNNPFAKKAETSGAE